MEHYNNNLGTLVVIFSAGVLLICLWILTFSTWWKGRSIKKEFKQLKQEKYEREKREKEKDRS